MKIDYNVVNYRVIEPSGQLGVVFAIAQQARDAAHREKNQDAVRLSNVGMDANGA